MIKTYIDQLNHREKFLVIGTGIFVLLCVLYFGVYEPLTNQKIESQRMLADKQQTLAWMKQVSQFAGRSSRQAIQSNSQLLTVLTEQLSKPELEAFRYQLQQSSSGNVQLSYDSVPFNQFTQWLLQFQSTFSVNIERLTATKEDKAGMVQITVIFKLS